MNSPTLINLRKEYLRGKVLEMRATMGTKDERRNKRCRERENEGESKPKKD